MMEKCFALYRYSHSDGTAKEWAIYVGSDTLEIEVRFGKAGQLSQQRLIDSTDPNAEADRRINEKINKGYRLVGQVGIDHQGRPFELSNALDSVACANNVSWEFRTRKDVNGQISLAQKALFDMAKLLEAYGLAVIDDNQVRIGEWSLGFCKSGLPSTNQISMVSGEGAGIVNTDDGPWPLLLLLAFKRQLPPLCSLTVASPEGIEVSDQLKLEKDVLRLLGSDLERVRPIAEALDLMPVKIDLNQSSPDSQNYYF